MYGASTMGMAKAFSLAMNPSASAKIAETSGTFANFTNAENTILLNGQSYAAAVSGTAE